MCRRCGRQEVWEAGGVGGVRGVGGVGAAEHVGWGLVCAPSSGCRLQGAGYRVHSAGHASLRTVVRVQGTGCKATVQGTPRCAASSGCRVQATGCRVQGARCRVQGARRRVRRRRVQGAGCRVRGAGCGGAGCAALRSIVASRSTYLPTCLLTYLALYSLRPLGPPRQPRDLLLQIGAPPLRLLSPVYV